MTRAPLFPLKTADQIKQLWLDVTRSRDTAFELRDRFAKSDELYSVLWLAAEDLNQAAKRLARAVPTE